MVRQACRERERERERERTPHLSSRPPWPTCCGPRAVARRPSSMPPCSLRARVNARSRRVNVFAIGPCHPRRTALALRCARWPGIVVGGGRRRSAGGSCLLLHLPQSGSARRSACSGGPQLCCRHGSARRGPLGAPAAWRQAAARAACTARFYAARRGARAAYVEPCSSIAQATRNRRSPTVRRARPWVQPR